MEIPKYAKWALNFWLFVTYYLAAAFVLSFLFGFIAGLLDKNISDDLYVLIGVASLCTPIVFAARAHFRKQFFIAKA